MSIVEIPKGELATRTLAMPADTNPNGDIFGGWILSQMDIAAGIVAKDICRGRAATVHLDEMTFHRPVKVGDALSCFVELIKIGKTSMILQIEAWAHRNFEHFKVTEGTFVYVAIDDNGKPRPVKAP